MRVRKQLTTSDYDFFAVTAAEVEAILLALRHEDLRSQARQQDERISANNRDLERANQKLLRSLGHSLSDALGERVSERAQAS